MSAMPLMSPEGVYELDGSAVKYGSAVGDSATVSETPTQVRELMMTSTDDMLELHHISTSEPTFVDRRYIIAIKPHWRKVSAG